MREDLWKYTKVEGFEGGVNRDWASDNLKKNQHLTLKNVDLSTQRGVAKRPGTERVTSAALVDATEKVRSMHRYYQKDGDKYFLAQSGTKFFSINLGTGAATQLATGLPEVDARCLTYNDIAYCFNSDASDTGFHKYTGAAWTSNISGGSIPAKGFTGGVIHEDKLFAWGDADNPSYLYFSNAYAPETFSAGDVLRIRDDDGDKIRGACHFVGGQLLVLKDTSAWVISGSDGDSFSMKPASDKVGLIGNTLQEVDGRPIWLSPLGVCWYNPYSANEPFRIISRDKINEELLAHSRAVLDAAVGKFIPRKNIYLLSLPTASTPTIYAFHLSIVAYSKDGRPFKTFPITNYEGVTVTAIETADGAGDDGTAYWGELVGQISSCSDSVYTDNGADIDIELQTGYLDLGLPDHHKRLDRLTVPVNIVGDTTNTVSVQIQKDWSASETVTQGALASSDVLIWDQGKWDEKLWGSDAMVSNIRFRFHKVGFNKCSVIITKSRDGRFSLHPFTLRWIVKNQRRWLEQAS